MKNAAIPIVSSIFDGPPYTAFVLANPITGYDDATYGRVIARCQHRHREHHSAYACAKRLWRGRCPAQYRRSL